MIVQILLIIAAITLAAIIVSVGRVNYLQGHRAGFTAGRAEGYRAGLISGHSAGVDQAAQLAGQLAAAGPCRAPSGDDSGYCARPLGLQCLEPTCYQD
jgi:hypothetical protein